MKRIATGLLAATMALGAQAAYAQTPDDAQIAGIVVTANTVDIDAGKLAQKKTKNKEVRQLAHQMVVDHTGVNKDAAALVKRLHVTPSDSDTRSQLKQAGDSNLAKLRGLRGAAFDKAYVDNEVTYHQTVIDALDKTLIPSASNADLKAMLVKVRPAFLAHLEHAKHVQSTLK